MTTEPDAREESRREELRARWEEVLRDVAGPEEGEGAGRKAEVEALAELSSHVGAFAIRHDAPPQLHEHFARLAEEAGRQRRLQRRRMWRAALAGALAASVVIAVGGFTAGVLFESKDPYHFIAEEARAMYQRAMLDKELVRARESELNKVLAWFQGRLPYQPRVFFPGETDLVLEGGRLGEIAGKKVANFVYQAGGRHFLLVVLRAKDNPSWAALPSDRWVINSEDHPWAIIWRRGEFIYSLVGYAPEEKFKKIFQKPHPSKPKAPPPPAPVDPYADLDDI